MWPEIILDISLGLKIQYGRYIFNVKLQNDIIFDRVERKVYARYARPSGVPRKYFRRSIDDKVSNTIVTHLRSNVNLI